MKPRYAMLALMGHRRMGMKSLCLPVILLAMASLLSGCATLLAAMRNRAAFYEADTEEVTVQLTSPVEHPSGGSLGNRTFNVRRGDTRETMVSSCGPPGLMIGSNVWVYSNCTPPNAAAMKSHYDTLVVVFVRNQVQEIRLVSGRTLRDFLETNLPRMRNLE
ncbi:MAG TPA: hypothetical protein VG734_19245 [Lacunisphaera sp.]|nr:hypothetical protein [Lacunisphaera sp.]